MCTSCVTHVTKCEWRRFIVCECVAECCRVLQSVAECCSVLQCVAVCCSVLQCEWRRFIVCANEHTMWIVCHMYEWRMLQMWMSHVRRVYNFDVAYLRHEIMCHTYGRSMFRTWMSHVTRGCLWCSLSFTWKYVSLMWLICDMGLCVTHMIYACYTCEWVTLDVTYDFDVACLWHKIVCRTYEGAMSHM